MLKECTYTLEGRSGSYTFDSIWSALNSTELDELNSITDILYSKYPKLEALKTRLENLKLATKEKKESLLSYLLNGDISYSGENGEIAISTFITLSPEAVTNGIPIVEQLNVDEFRESEIKYLTSEQVGMSELEAKREIEREINNWDIIAEDSRDLHKLVTDPIIAVPEDKRNEFIQRAKSSLNKSSRLYDDELLGKLYDDLREFYLKNKGHFVESEVIRNINISSLLKELGTKLFGHVDYIFIDTFGNLLVYNFKVTTKPYGKWSKNKKESYHFETAFLKLMLSSNGLGDIKNININLVPLLLNYSEDCKLINGLAVKPAKNLDYNKDSKYIGTSYDNTAKFFIESPTYTENITSDNIKIADQINSAIFPFFDVKSDVIGKTVDQWIKTAPTIGETEPLRIVEELPGLWKVFINGIAHEISDPTSKKRNKEIRNLVAKHLDKLNNNSSYINNIKNYLIDSYRRGFVNLEDLKRNSDFFDHEFSQYVEKLGEDKYLLYELIDDLAECNILLFKHKKTGIIDIITLSLQNLDILPKYSKGNSTNVLGEYRRDSLIDMLYGDMGGIEAIRTMVLLNQVIQKIPNAKLGLLKVVSQFGDKKIYDTELIANKYLREIFKVIKQEVRDLPNFSYNFKSSNFTDPVDNLLKEYNSILENNSQNYGAFFAETIGLENLTTVEDKNSRRKALAKIAEVILSHFSKDADIEAIAKDTRPNPLATKLRDLAKLYLLVTDAYLNYSGEHLEYGAPISSARSFVTTSPTVPSLNIRIVVNNLQTTLDAIAENIESDYTLHMRKFLMEFYNEFGYSSLENITIGDLNRLFKNMYLVDSNGKRIMKFKNPYLNEGNSSYLTPTERKFLKQALFEFNRIRLLRRKDILNFTSYNDPRIADYILNNPNGERYLWVPLKRASKTSQRLDINVYTNNFKRKIKQFLKFGGKLAFDEFVNDLTPEERLVLDLEINELSIRNPMLEWENDATERLDRINKLGVDYFEVNVEDLLLNFLARSVEVDKFLKFLVGTKMLLLKLDLMGGDSIKNEIKYIEDYIKVNVFLKSIMEARSLTLVGMLTPVRKLVTYANLAGNAVAYLRDIENGFFENFLRTVTKFLTDINASNLTKAYGYVVTHGTSNPMNINMLSKLCVRYRLSNTDLARITERLKSNRGGFFNWDNWAFATLRSPDFLNRMTLFVAKAMLDGCFDAWYIENDELKYDWKKDKRFEIYAKGDKTNPEYTKQKGLYIMKINEWNLEHPNAEKSLEYSDDLPSPYSNQDILAIRNVGDNIYGSYDRSLRAMGENKALGWVFGMYTTWMNGMWNNWFMKPGKYNIHQMNTIVETNENGEELWMDENGILLVLKIDEKGNKYYINADTGEKGVPDVPIFKKLPVIVQGIIYTFLDLFQILREDGIQTTKDYLRGNDVAKKNIKHAIYTSLIALLHLILLKLVLEKLYKELKKHAKEYSLASNIMAELGYKSMKQAGDSFRGLYNILDYVGDSDPPMYKVPTKLMGDAAKFVLGKKSFLQLITGNFAIARSFRDTARIYETSK